MTRHEELRDNYEDALFALLMDEFAEREGERLLEENERLKLDPDIVISDELDKRCIKTIDRTFAKGKRRKVKYAAYRMISRVAVAVLAVVVLFGTAYAAFPEVRIRTLNLIIELSDQAASLTLERANNSMQNDDGASAELNEDGTLRGYRLPEIPEGFELEYDSNTSVSTRIRYTNAYGISIGFSVIAARGTALNVDTENAEEVKNISIHGYSGLLVKKGEGIDITWADTDQNNFIMISCDGLDEETVWGYAEIMEYVK